MIHKIKFNKIEEVKEFVHEASKCDFDIDVSYNRQMVDGKSILGILCMDLSRTLTVYCHGQSQKFASFLSKLQPV